MKILAIDPGRTTGYCYGNLILPNEPTQRADTVMLELTPVQELDDVQDLWARLFDYEPRIIVIEDFEFRQRSRAGLDLFSVQLIGVTRLYEQLAKSQVGVYIQKAAQGKSYYSDTILKQLDLYDPKVKHGRDALRHLLHWITFGSGYQYIEGKQIKDIARLV